MGALLAFLPTLISLIPSAMGAAQSIIGFIASIRTAAQQSGEWTPELEGKFLDALISRTTSPAWTPDPPKAVGTVTKEVTTTTTTA